MIIETENDKLKNNYQIKHPRHRRFTNLLSNIVSGLISYRFLTKNPAIKQYTIKTH